MEVRCPDAWSSGLIDGREIVVSCFRAKNTVIKLGWVVLPEGFTSCCLSVTSLGNPVDRLESEGE